MLGQHNDMCDRNIHKLPFSRQSPTSCAIENNQDAQECRGSGTVFSVAATTFHKETFHGCWITCHTKKWLWHLHRKFHHHDGTGIVSVIFKIVLPVVKDCCRAIQKFMLFSSAMRPFSFIGWCQRTYYTIQVSDYREDSEERKFRFNEPAPQLILQDGQYNLCTRCLQGAWSRCVVVTWTGPLVTLIWSHTINFQGINWKLRYINITRELKVVILKAVVVIQPNLLVEVMQNWQIYLIDSIWKQGRQLDENC